MQQETGLQRVERLDRPLSGKANLPVVVKRLRRVRRESNHSDWAFHIHRQLCNAVAHQPPEEYVGRSINIWA